MGIVRLYLLLVLIVVVSCTREKRPEGILPRQEMVKVLTEIYLAEEKIQRLGVRPDSAKQIFARIEPRVFEQTGVSDSAFHRSLKYYMARPKQMEQIYSVLVDSLNLMEQRTSFETDPQ